MSTHKPNEEQRDIIAATRTGEKTLIEAGAGTGKTSTLEMVASAMRNKRILDLVFNKAAQLDAAGRMPQNVVCKTSHGLAYGPVGRNYSSRLNEGRMPSWKLAQRMGWKTIALPVGNGLAERLAPPKVASIVRRTVDRFCHSDMMELAEVHVPWIGALGEAGNASLKAQILPLAVDAWTDIVQNMGNFPFSHDCYLKIYQLSAPRLPYEVLMLDEAQDTNPCVADIVMRQEHLQVIMVGDSNQAIYEWRGARDAMQAFDYVHRLQLTGSYRFGPAIAEVANGYLEQLPTDLRLKGYRKLASEVTDDPLESPSAVLCRGNAGCIMEAMKGLAAGRRTAIVGGGGPIAQLARAAAQLMAGATTDHPDLIAFSTWQEVRDYVKSDREDAGSLAPLVKIVDSVGTDAILAMCDQLADEQRGRPELVVTTAHKAKGREWTDVQIGPDFAPRNDKEDASPDPSETRLKYVAVTRAKLTLGRGSLAPPRDTFSRPLRDTMRDKHVEDPGYDDRFLVPKPDEDDDFRPLPSPMPDELAEAIRSAAWEEM